MRLDKSEDFERNEWLEHTVKKMWWLDLMAMLLVIAIGVVHFVLFFRGV